MSWQERWEQYEAKRETRTEPQDGTEQTKTVEYEWNIEAMA